MCVSRNLVGPRVRTLREQRGFTQAVLAARCNLQGWNLSRETLAKIESQVRWVSDCELLCLAQALHTPLESLLPQPGEASRVMKTFFRNLEQR